MKKTINGIEFTDCTFVNCDGERVNGLFVHDLSDEFHNGDGVVADVELPDSWDDAEMILANEFIDTDSETLGTIEW